MGVLVEVHESEGKLKKILKKVKKFAKKLAGEDEEECHIVWEEHTQPHCTTTFSEHCKTEHKNQCTTEYSTECKDEIEKVCKTETQCSTTYVDKCTPLVKKPCETTYSSPQSGRWKREASDEDSSLDIDNLSAAELLDIARDSAVESSREDDENDGRGKRGVLKKGLKKVKKIVKKLISNDDDCGEEPAGQHCEKVPQQSCEDVEKCWKEP